MLLALPPNQKGYRMAGRFFLSSALAGFLPEAASAEAMASMRLLGYSSELMLKKGERKGRKYPLGKHSAREIVLRNGGKWRAELNWLLA